MTRLAAAHVANESGFLRIAAALACEGLTASLHQVQIILSKYKCCFVYFL